MTVADIVISVAWKLGSLHYEVQYDTAVNWSVLESGVPAISLGEQSVNDDDENGRVGRKEKQQCEQRSKRCNMRRSVDVDVDRVRFLRC